MTDAVFSLGEFQVTVMKFMAQYTYFGKYFIKTQPVCTLNWELEDHLIL